jgi:CRP-like cAMP-binding protein
MMLIHLRAVKSPVFRTACKRTTLNKEIVNLFHSEFSYEIKTTINSRLTTPEELWTIMRQYSDNHNCSIPLLSSLSIWEAKLFLHFCGSIVHCHIGDRITSCGNISQELIILLSGKANSPQKGTILSGEYCGDNGLADLTKHAATVIALDDLDILVLSYYNFSSFRKRQPNIARKILSNLQK